MLLTQLQRLPSTFSFTEASRVLPELLPLRDILYDLLEREIREEIEAEFEAGPLAAADKRIELLEEQIEAAQSLVNMLRRVSKRKYRYKETKEVMEEIVRHIESSNFEN